MENKQEYLNFIQMGSQWELSLAYPHAADVFIWIAITLVVILRCV